MHRGRQTDAAPLQVAGRKKSSSTGALRRPRAVIRNGSSRRHDRARSLDGDLSAMSCCSRNW